MSLRVKIELLLLVVFVLVVGLGYWMQRLIILPGFSPLEERLAVEDMNKGVAAVEDHIALLESLCSSWSTRPSTVRIVQDERVTDGEPDITLSSLIDNDLTFIYLIDLEGTVVWHKTLDLVCPH